MFTPTQTGQVSFDFYVAAGGLTNLANTNRGFLLRLMSDVTNNFAHYDETWAATGVFVSANDTITRKGAGNGQGTTNTFSFLTDQKNTLMFAFNNSVLSYNYVGTNSVASGSMDVWLNGTKMATWAMGQGTNAGVGSTVNGLWMQLPSSVEGTIRLDNISVIPEPGVTALLATALSGLLIFSRRRGKK